MGENLTPSFHAIFHNRLMLLCWTCCPPDKCRTEWVWPAVMKMSLTRVGIGVVVVSPSPVNSVTDWFVYGSTVVTERFDILSAGVDSVVVASEAVKFSVSDVVVMPSSETLVVVVSLSSKSASRSAKRSIRFHSQSRGLQLQMVPIWWICLKPEVSTLEFFYKHYFYKHQASKSWKIKHFLSIYWGWTKSNFYFKQSF